MGIIVSVCDTAVNSRRTLLSLNLTFVCFFSVDKRLSTRHGGLGLPTEVALTLLGVLSGGTGRTSALRQAARYVLPLLVVRRLY